MDQMSQQTTNQSLAALMGADRPPVGNYSIRPPNGTVKPPVATVNRRLRPLEPLRFPFDRALTGRLAEPDTPPDPCHRPVSPNY